MTDEQKIDALAHYAMAIVRTTKVVNGMTRGTMQAAGRQERKALVVVMTALLGRKPTEEELDSVTV